MESKTSKRKHLGKENVPAQQELGQQGLLKVETRASRDGSTGLTEKVSNEVENNETSTTIKSNANLNKLTKAHEGKQDQLQGGQLQKQTSIKSSQSQTQSPKKQQESKTAEKQQKAVHKSESDKNTNQYSIYQLVSQMIKKQQETVEQQKNWKQENPYQNQENESQPQTIQKHYIIPGTMFEGQYTYVTKEKKEEGMEKQLEEIQRENQELEISTEHYVNPTTVVQGQVKMVGKELKKQEIEKEIEYIEEKNADENKPQQAKIVPRVNLHKFHSTEVPELHQQDIPLQHKVEQLSTNLHDDRQQPEIMPIKSLDPVPVEVKPGKEEEKLPPLYIDVPKSKDLPPQYEHYIIPGTMFEGQFTYVSKQKKEEEIEQELKHLEEEKKELQLSTQHYVNPSSVVEGQRPKATKQLKKDSFEQSLGSSFIKSRSRSAEKLEDFQNSQPLIGIKNQESKSHFSRLSSFELQALKFMKEKDPTEGSLKLQITNQKKKKLPLKIDQKSAMTVISQKKKEKPTFILPKDEEPNYDLEVLVLDASLNKDASSPKNAFNVKPTTLVSMNKVPEIIGDLKTKDGSPIKVIIGTKQFANFPNQVTPSPPIIDEATLIQLRKKNQQQMKKNGEVVSPPPKVFISRGSEESYEYQTSAHANKMKMDSIFISQQPIYIGDEQCLKSKKRQKKRGDKKQPQLLVKIARSLAISSVVGGFAWLGFKDSKISVVSALAGLALAFAAQQ